MAAIHMSEAEVVKDIEGVLAKVHEGIEIVIEQDHRPVATIKPAKPVVGRLITDVIEDLRAHREDLVMDEDFARDIEAGIRAMRGQCNPPSEE